ncbi:unnamed protein product, partial [Discosporangium mesarthrocarpum]
LEELCRGGRKKLRIWSQVEKGGEISRVPKEVELHIERGMKTGSRIVLHGEADAGVAGVAPGDLVFVVREAPHPVFRRLGGYHLVAEVTVTLAEALTGLSRPIDLPDGRRVFFRSKEGEVVPPGSVHRVE